MCLKVCAPFLLLLKFIREPLRLKRNIRFLLEVGVVIFHKTYLTLKSLETTQILHQFLAT